MIKTMRNVRHELFIFGHEDPQDLLDLLDLLV